MFHFSNTQTNKYFVWVQVLKQRAKKKKILSLCHKSEDMAHPGWFNIVASKQSMIVKIVFFLALIVPSFVQDKNPHLKKGSITSEFSRREVRDQFETLDATEIRSSS